MFKHFRYNFGISVLLIICLSIYCPNSIAMNIVRLILPALLLLPTAAFAQVPAQLQGRVDPGRVDADRRLMLDAPGKKSPSIDTPSAVLSEAPEGAKDINFVLQDVQVDGVTAFSREEIAALFDRYKNTNITLDMVWQFASDLTRLYRDEGYFLSRAYVPAQDIDNGVIVLKVVEGYIGEIKLDDDLGKSYVADMASNDLLEEKPVNIDSIESYLLRLNDLPGVEYRAVLSPMDEENASEGAVVLVLQPEEESGAGMVRLDNFGSRFLGPYQASAYYETSFTPLHETSVTLLSSIPVRELQNGSIKHSVTLTPSLIADVSGSLTQAEPGYTLRRFDLKSRSVSWEGGLTYQMIRQRGENLSLRLALNGRNTTSNLAGTPFTRDRIVALRTSISYELMDDWAGQNILGLTLSQGIDGLGSSEKNDLFLSRSQAGPDFTKLEMSMARAQSIGQNFLLQGRVSGQLASDALYSSEEYGYGGQVFGRAYDSSELTGDEGISASLEVQYNGFRHWDPVGLAPYVFYDIGKIWNEDAGQPKTESAASAGFGVRFDTKYDISGELGLAFPLTQSADTPLYGGNGSNPRILFQISKKF